MKTTNYTYPTYERTEADQAFLIVYVAWILLADWIGNSFIIYSTVNHRAIKMDKTSVWIIQNLATVDLCSSITVMVPMFITNIYGNHWVLGTTVCNIVGYMKYFFLILSIFFLMSLSLNKLIRCLYPLRQLYCAKKTLVRSTIMLYVFTSLQTFYMLTLHELGITEVIFMPTQSYCSMVSPGSPNRMWYFEIVCHLIYNILPLLVLSVCNVSLLFLTCSRSSRQIKKSSVVSVIVISFMFMSCTFVYSLTRVILHFKHSAVSGQFLTFAYYLHTNTYWVNPPLYLITNPGFRNFVCVWVSRGAFTSKIRVSDLESTRHCRLPIRMASDQTFVRSRTVSSSGGMTASSPLSTFSTVSSAVMRARHLSLAPVEERSSGSGVTGAAAGVVTPSSTKSQPTSDEELNEKSESTFEIAV